MGRLDPALLGKARVRSACALGSKWSGSRHTGRRTSVLAVCPARTARKMDVGLPSRVTPEPGREPSAAGGPPESGGTRHHARSDRRARLSNGVTLPGPDCTKPPAPSHAAHHPAGDRGLRDAGQVDDFRHVNGNDCSILAFLGASPVPDDWMPVSGGAALRWQDERATPAPRRTGSVQKDGGPAGE